MRRKSLIIILIACLPLLSILNLMTGSVEIPCDEIIKILFGNEDVDQTWQNIVLRTRLPQTLTALACGSCLSVAGLEMQTIFKNPLAGPSVIGVSSAASLGVALVVLMNGAFGGVAISKFGIIGNTAITLAASAGAMMVMAIISLLSQKIENKATLLIAGVMIGYIASAVTGVLKYFSSEEDIRTYVIWGLGSFSKVTGGQVYVFVGLVALMLPPTILLQKPLNQLLLGEKYAENLGLNIKKARLLTLLSAGALTAIATAYCGPIMFIGLAVPHICKGMLDTTDHKILLPATMVCGGVIALLCNLIAKMPGAEGSLPINSVTALIGAPVALKVILKKHIR